MEIKNLANTHIEVIVECLAQSFKNYFVKIPNDVHYWTRRYSVARVDYNLSFGVFDNGILVAFIIHGIDFHNGKMTAFNTGTGVLENYRGQKLVDQIYEFALPILKENKVEKCMLEVIDQNHRAVSVYERIGFEKDRFLRCFSGAVHFEENNTKVREVKLDQLIGKIDHYQKHYAWDNSMDAVLKGGSSFKPYLVSDSKTSDLGYFLINTDSRALIQIESFDDQNWKQIITATKEIISPIRLNNVDSTRVNCINTLLAAGIKNHINQYEMILLL
jgi:ribosomal protein S18 acetylase RimI-like enzyme